jgi:hypothetical protein
LKKNANTGPRARASPRENLDPSIAGNSNCGAGVPAVSVAIRFAPNKSLSHFMAGLFFETHWMIPALRRIFFASPVSGKALRREILTHAPLGPGGFRPTTPTLKSVMVIECRRENRSLSEAFRDASSGNSHMLGIRLELLDLQTKNTELLRRNKEYVISRRCWRGFRLIALPRPRVRQKVWIGQFPHWGLPGRQTVAPNSIMA